MSGLIWRGTGQTAYSSPKDQLRREIDQNREHNKVIREKDGSKQDKVVFSTRPVGVARHRRGRRRRERIYVGEVSIHPADPA